MVGDRQVVDPERDIGMDRFWQGQALCVMIDRPDGVHVFWPPSTPIMRYWFDFYETP